MAVVLQEQQWILGRADQHVQVRRHAGEKAEDTGDAGLLRGCHAGGCGGAENALTQRIHRDYS